MKLKDVEFSQQGEQNVANTHEAELVNIALTNNAKATNGYTIYKLVNTKQNGRVNIDGIDDVINPKTGKMERIWLLTGADSIWQSDLTELLKDKDYVRQNRRSLQFESKILRIPDWDERALEFAKHCRHNIDNPKRKSGSKFEFFEYNPKKQQEEALKREYFELEMAMEAQKQPEEAMKKHAFFLGITAHDELGELKSPEGIRREYMLAAKRDPKRFKDTLNSKEVTISYLIKRAILDAKIDVGGPSGNITWAKGGAICKLPTSRKAQEYLIELAMTNSDEGRAFLETLEQVSK